MYGVAIPETENPQEAKRVYPGKPARIAQADPVRYFTHNVGFLAGRLIDKLTPPYLVLYIF